MSNIKNKENSKLFISKKFAVIVSLVITALVGYISILASDDIIPWGRGILVLIVVIGIITHIRNIKESKRRS